MNSICQPVLEFVITENYLKICDNSEMISLVSFSGSIMNIIIIYHGSKFHYSWRLQRRFQKQCEESTCSSFLICTLIRRFPGFSKCRSVLANYCTSHLYTSNGRNSQNRNVIVKKKNKTYECWFREYNISIVNCWHLWKRTKIAELWGCASVMYKRKEPQV